MFWVVSRSSVSHKWFAQERLTLPIWHDVDLLMTVLFEQMQHAVDVRYGILENFGNNFNQTMTTAAVSEASAVSCVQHSG